MGWKREEIKEQEMLGRTNRLLSCRYILSIWYDMNCTENDACNSSYIFACVFVAAVMCLPSRCLAKIGRHTVRWCLKFRFIFSKWGQQAKNGNGRHVDEYFTLIRVRDEKQGFSSWNEVELVNTGGLEWQGVPGGRRRRCCKSDFQVDPDFK
jgi:hypothetical protein